MGLIEGNALYIPLADESVHCVVTSPPYWGLRKYAGDQGEEPLGLEPTPERHVERMVEIFREVRRVLRDDGVFWLNYGDTYGTGTTAGRPDGNTRGIGDKTSNAQNINRPGGPAGSLMMMPHRVALALQADGWIVRQDLVWFKRNPMPESVAGTRWVKHRIKEGRSKHASDHNIKGGTQKMLEDASVHQGIDEDWVPKYVDCPGCEKCIPNDGLILKRGSWRHTRSHEFIFQLVKGPKMKYWSNQEAVREAHTSTRWGGDTITQPPTTKYAEATAQGFAGAAESLSRPGREWNAYPAAGRNPRSVLDVPTAPYKGAHYATFPPNLIAPLIRATCPRWACPVCGQGWAAVVEMTAEYRAVLDSGRAWQTDKGKPDEFTNRHNSDHPSQVPQKNSVLGYRPTCEHPHTQEEAVPGIVFDPFVGSGTTVKVAQDLLRRGIGLDISRPYLEEQAKLRTGGSPKLKLEELPLFANA